MKSLFLKIFFILLLFPSFYFSQELWKQSDGPAGGTVENIILSKNNTIFATLAHQGIIRSVNNGSSWTKSNNGLTTINVLAIHEHSNGFLFAGTVADGIFRSTNNGIQWSNVKEITDLPFSESIRSFTSDNLGNVYAGAQFSGVYLSTNNGNSWERVNEGLTTRNIEVMASTPNGSVFAGTMSGVFRTTNQGSSWEKINIAIFPADISTLHVTYDGVLYAGTYSQGISRSYDNGDTWQIINLGLSSITSSEYPVIYSITSDPKNQVYAGSYLDGVFYLNSIEDRWFKTNHNLTDKSVYCLTALNDNTLLAGTSRGGVFSTNTNSVNWVEKNKGIYATDIYDLYVGIDGYVFASVFGRGIYASKDNGNSWALENSGMNTPYIFSVAANNDGVLFAGTFDGQISGVDYGHGVFRSTDSGSSWIPANNGISSNWINKLAINPVNNDLYAATLNGNAVYKSSNNGSSWTKVIDEQTANAFTFNTDGDVFAAIYNSGIYRSSNNGMNWTSVNSGLPAGPVLKLPNQVSKEQNFRRHSRYDLKQNKNILISSGSTETDVNITALGIDGHGTIYAGAYGEIFRSINNGEEWTLITNSLGNGWVTSLVFDAHNNLYAAVDGVVFRSTDYGFTWSEYNNGLTNYSEILVVSPSNQLFAGSRGGSVFLSVSPSTLQIISFNALLEGSIVKFSWEVETDLLNQSIIIEKSIDKINWNELAVITQFKTGSNSFSFVESDIQSPEHYYRLVSNATDVKSILSKTISVDRETLPTGFTLDQNYPNPFNPSTTISFSVPQLTEGKSQLVVLKVFDALGAELSTLVNEVKSAGTYNVAFYASDYSSGVYFYTLQGGNFRETKKMILTK